MSQKVVVGLVPNTREPGQVVQSLIDSGFKSENISLIVREQNTVRVAEGDGDGNGILDGAAEGAGKGGLLGALTGLLIGIGALTIPGIGGLLVGGPLIASLGLTGAAATTASGAVTGGLAGGLLGGLSKLGFDKNQSQIYVDQISQGSSLIMISPGEDRLNEAENALRNMGATEVRTVSVES